MAAPPAARPSTGGACRNRPVAVASWCHDGGVSIDVDAPTPFPSDIEIAEAADITPVVDLARDALGIPAEALVPYGHTKAKVSLRLPRARWRTAPTGTSCSSRRSRRRPPARARRRPRSAWPTACAGSARRACVALREPSMGPVFGMKGGAAGRRLRPGRADDRHQPALHRRLRRDRRGEQPARRADRQPPPPRQRPRHRPAHRHLEARRRPQRPRPAPDRRRPRRRAPTACPREDGFDIVVASEVMAILCLADSLADLKRAARRRRRRLHPRQEPVTARDLQADGAMAVLLRDALAPNLVQTLEHTPAFIHGGPFANIAHGCNSVMATRTALKLADWVVTEAGFGADLGAEKFIDIKCRESGPAARGGRRRRDRAGAEVPRRRRRRRPRQRGPRGASRPASTNLRAAPREHPRRLRAHRPVVAVNRFPSDTDAEVDARRADVLARGRCAAYAATHVRDGGAGAEALARGVRRRRCARARATCASSTTTTSRSRRRPRRSRPRVYGAAGVTFDAKARRRLDQIEAAGYGHLPICMAKTQSSFSTDPSQRGAPSGHTVTSARSAWPPAPGSSCWSPATS